MKNVTDTNCSNMTSPLLFHLVDSKQFDTSLEADTATWRIGHCTIRQLVFDCKYLSCKICFNLLYYVFIFNLYCSVNI